MQKNKGKENLIYRFGLGLIIAIVCVNHFLTFMAYDWYAGVDGYSYDVAGLQLLSREVFDLYPVLFRPPLIPIAKNILYLLFEGHPYALFVFIHLIGVAMAILAYKLGCKFHRVVGFFMGLFTALNLPMSVNFHHISTFTIFVPLLLFAANCFASWMKKTDFRMLILLILAVFMCTMARTEALVLIPIFSVFGCFSRQHRKQMVFFLISSIFLYNVVCLYYFRNFGYWGVTCNGGWSAFLRISRTIDRQFDARNGPASLKVQEYMDQEWPLRVKDIDFYRFQMMSLSLAQQKLGYLEADRLFGRAVLEAIFASPGKFIRFTFLRVLGQLDLWHTPGLNHRELFDGVDKELDTEHMWGFSEKRMKDKRERFIWWSPALLKIESPFRWERAILKAKILRIFGFNTKLPKLPEAFKLSPIVALNASGGIEWLFCGDSNMTERMWHCLDLDAYFYLKYLGQKEWSSHALRILSYWDKFFMPKEQMRLNIHRIMWILWVAGIFIKRKEPRLFLPLTAFMCIVVSYAFMQAIFSDNFGGRFELQMRPFLWLGALCGVIYIIERWRYYIKETNGAVVKIKDNK